jgi:hypothetical protein
MGNCLSHPGVLYGKTFTEEDFENTPDVPRHICRYLRWESVPEFIKLAMRQCVCKWFVTQDIYTANTLYFAGNRYVVQWNIEKPDVAILYSHAIRDVLKEAKITRPHILYYYEGFWRVAFQEPPPALPKLEPRFWALVDRKDMQNHSKEETERGLIPLTSRFLKEVGTRKIVMKLTQAERELETSDTTKLFVPVYPGEGVKFIGA